MSWRQGQALGQDLRDRVLAVSGGSAGMADRFGVSISYVIKARQRRDRLGQTTPGAQRSHTPAKLAAHDAALCGELARQPDATLAELQAWALATRGVAVSISAISARLIFIDETWAKTNMTRPRGRAPRGQRLIGRVPHGHWKTSTFLAGLRHDRIVAPLVLDGAINGEVFRAWVEQFLAPGLTAGDIVVADDLARHKVRGVRTAIEARGAELWFLPPYSPDLNPIGQASSKVKALIRKAAPRSREALWNSIGSIVTDVSPQQCANMIANSGYIQSG